MKRTCFLIIVALAALAGPSQAGRAAAWQPARAPLMTRWALALNPTNVLPEYPRPQLVRPDWLNLNGLWDYALAPDSVQAPPAFTGQILVPFPLESALSGVMTNLDERSKLWYHRTFTVPPSWQGKHVRLHFGAVDWQCDVWVNGHHLGRHQGGYDAFSFDVTDALRWNGPEDLLVLVMDSTDVGDHPRGKQSPNPEGIFYTSTSGIWQTVWLEPVPKVCIDSLKMVPDVDSQSLHLWVAANNFSDNLQVETIASVNGQPVASITGPANQDLVLNVPHPRLWTPDDPFLYDLKVTLKKGDVVQDSVTSYFGMRKIALEHDDQGVPRIMLNNQSIFQVGILDQGFWPDGIYTAPADDAIRSDIDFLKRSGFNLIRKHVKVEPDRWYYWCDKLGMLVWQDMPSSDNETPAGRHDFESELLHMISHLQAHPSIVTWVLFNEGWGQFDTESLVKLIKQVDPSRLVDNASGWTDMRAGDLVDMHSYPGPDAPDADANRAAVLGEYGGLGMVVPGHAWSSNNWGYVMLTNSVDLASNYTVMLKEVWRLHALRGLNAAVYTQNADVETECNGLQTYDRSVIKINPDILLAANRGGFWAKPTKVILPNALFGHPAWKFTTIKPADNWLDPGFDVSNWKDGIAGFGTVGTPNIVINTTWDTDDIWLRRDFTLKSSDIPGLELQVFHDEDVEVYFNGVLAFSQPGFITDYNEYPISQAAIEALRAGENTIAVHCHQTTGGQGIDVGLFSVQPAVSAK